MADYFDPSTGEIIKVPDGIRFVKEGWSPTRQFKVGDIVPDNGSAYICIERCLDKPLTNTIYWRLLVKKGDPGKEGAPGKSGKNGREIELKLDGTSLMWRYVGDILWISLGDIQGPRGKQGPPGKDGIPGAPGKDAPAIELRVTKTFIQWHYVGEDTWQNLIRVADLVGAPGKSGRPGPAGSDGASAYQIWLANGNNGTPQDFLNSLVGSGSAWFFGTEINDDQGKSGDLFLNTNDGSLWQKVGGAWDWGAPIGNLMGPAGGEGQPGEPGLTYRWFVLPGVPNDNLGNDGELYLDTETNNIYQKSEDGNSHWELKATLQSSGPEAAVDRTFEYTEDGKLHIINDIYGTKTFIYENNKVSQVIGTGLYPSLNYIWDGDRLIRVEVQGE